MQGRKAEPCQDRLSSEGTARPPRPGSGELEFGVTDVRGASRSPWCSARGPARGQDRGVCSESSRWCHLPCPRCPRCPVQLQPLFWNASPPGSARDCAGAAARCPDESCSRSLYLVCFFYLPWKALATQYFVEGRGGEFINGSCSGLMVVLQTIHFIFNNNL